MATKRKKKKPPHTARLAKRPPTPVPSRSSRGVWVVVAATVAVALGIGIALIARGGGDSGSSGLPDTADYHSLLVGESDADELTLGTHDGLYRSVDGGVHWSKLALAGDDAMNLARAGSATWLAGHDVLKKSVDGRSWSSVAPRGLPSMDIHGFAVDPNEPRTLYAAVAGRGL